MLRLFGIAAGGAAGALARYGLGMAVGVRTFPWVTLVINLIGSFLLGVTFRASGQRGPSDAVALMIAVGFLGAFTTFSTFSFETQALLRAGRPGAAAAYVAVSVVGGVMAAAAGYGIGRALA